MSNTIRDILKSTQDIKPIKNRSIYLNLTPEQYKTEFTRIAKEIEPRYEINKNNINQLTQIEYWLAGSSNFKGDINRGLLLVGGFGNGKTTITKIIQRMLFEFPNKTMKFISSLSIADLCVNNYLYTIAKCPLIIDEIGKEETIVKHYGTDYKPMYELLTHRYNARALTIGTTNFSPTKLKEIYGDYLHERIKEMFNIVVFEGESFRKEIII